MGPPGELVEAEGIEELYEFEVPGMVCVREFNTPSL